MTTPATVAPRYRNYGELVNPAANTSKFWLVEEREGAVWVRHGRITPTLGRTPEERCRHLLNNPSLAAVKRVGQQVGVGSIANAIDRARQKENEGYTFLWNPHLGQPDAERSAPTADGAVAAPRRSRPEPPPAAPPPEPAAAPWMDQARRWF